MAATHLPADAPVGDPSGATDRGHTAGRRVAALVLWLQDKVKPSKLQAMLQPSKPAPRLPENRGSPLPQIPGGARTEDAQPWVAPNEPSLMLIPAAQDKAKNQPRALRQAACFHESSPSSA